jgi:phosphohistidine phosphatase SixA
MQRLILLRHGKAESVAATGGDFERGLTERGLRDAMLIGRALAEAGIVPTWLLSRRPAARGRPGRRRLRPFRTRAAKPRACSISPPANSWRTPR